MPFQNNTTGNVFDNISGTRQRMLQVPTCPEPYSQFQLRPPPTLTPQVPMPQPSLDTPAPLVIEPQPPSPVEASSINVDLSVVKREVAPAFHPLAQAQLPTVPSVPVPSALTVPVSSSNSLLSAGVGNTSHTAASGNPTLLQSQYGGITKSEASAITSSVPAPTNTSLNSQGQPQTLASMLSNPALNPSINCLSPQSLISGPSAVNVASSVQSPMNPSQPFVLPQMSTSMPSLSQQLGMPSMFSQPAANFQLLAQNMFVRALLNSMSSPLTALQMMQNLMALSTGAVQQTFNMMPMMQGIVQPPLVQPPVVQPPVVQPPVVQPPVLSANTVQSPLPQSQTPPTVPAPAVSPTPLSLESILQQLEQLKESGNIPDRAYNELRNSVLGSFGSTAASATGANIGTVKMEPAEIRTDAAVGTSAPTMTEQVALSSNPTAADSCLPVGVVANFSANAQLSDDTECTQQPICVVAKVEGATGTYNEQKPLLPVLIDDSGVQIPDEESSARLVRNGNTASDSDCDLDFDSGSQKSDDKKKRSKPGPKCSKKKSANAATSRELSALSSWNLRTSPRSNKSGPKSMYDEVKMRRQLKTKECRVELQQVSAPKRKRSPVHVVDDDVEPDTETVDLPQPEVPAEPSTAAQADKSARIARLKSLKFISDEEITKIASTPIRQMPVLKPEGQAVVSQPELQSTPSVASTAVAATSVTQASTNTIGTHVVPSTGMPAAQSVSTNINTAVSSVPAPAAGLSQGAVGTQVAPSQAQSGISMPTSTVVTSTYTPRVYSYVPRMSYAARQPPPPPPPVPLVFGSLVIIPAQKPATESPAPTFTNTVTMSDQCNRVGPGRPPTIGTMSTGRVQPVCAPTVYPIGYMSAGAIRHQIIPDPSSNKPKPMESLNIVVTKSINSSLGQRLKSVSADLEGVNSISVVCCTRREATGKRTPPLSQCLFCPEMAEVPEKLVRHIRKKHLELLFTLNKQKTASGPTLYIFCRHCDFVTTEPNVLWIHFEMYHCVPGIMDSGLLPAIDGSSAAPQLAPIAMDGLVSMVPTLVCCDCHGMLAAPDVDSAAMVLVQHVLREHPDSGCITGSLLKLLHVSRGVTAGSEHAAVPVTFRQAVLEPNFSHCRQDLFACLLCKFSSKDPYGALTHHLSAHQTKRLLYLCDDCTYQCTTDGDLIGHTTTIHRPSYNVAPITTTATIIDKVDDKFVECVVTVRRSTGIIFIKSRKKSRKRSRYVDEESAEADEDFEDNENGDDCSADKRQRSDADPEEACATVVQTSTVASSGDDDTDTSGPEVPQSTDNCTDVLQTAEQTTDVAATPAEHELADSVADIVTESVAPGDERQENSVA